MTQSRRSELIYAFYEIKKLRDIEVNKLVAFSVVTVICMASACSERQEIPSAFLGSWQCDEALTLESLEESKLVSPSDLRIFADDFFGDRKFVFRPSEYDAYWIGDDWGGTLQDVSGLPYHIVNSGPEFVILRTPNNEQVESKLVSWHVDGEYIFVDHSSDGWDFREYYRRVQP